MAVALMTAAAAPAAAVADIAQHRDVDVQHRTRPLVLVAADHFTGAPVRVGEPVDPAAARHRVDRGGRHSEPAPSTQGSRSCAISAGERRRAVVRLPRACAVMHLGVQTVNADEGLQGG